MNVISRTGCSAVGLAVVVCCTSLGCAPSTTQTSAPVVYPTPPDIARIQFLRTISTSQDLGKDESFWKQLVGTQDDGAKGIVKPYGLAMHDGKIYVCDTFLNGLDIIDLESGSWDYFLPVGNGHLVKPTNCFVDEDGILYVVDTQRAEVVVYDAGRDYVGALGGGADATPGDVFVTDDRVWLTDLASGTVRVFDKSSQQLLFTFPEADSDEEQFLGAPANLYVTGEAVYVSDMFLGKVNVYSLDGTYLRTVGSHGTGFGQFSRPKGIAVDRDENLYVVDAAFQNVQVFDRNGRLLMYFGGAGTQPGNMTLPAKVIIDYVNVGYFEQYAHPDFTVQYLILVTNQFGPNKIGIYGFVGPPQREAIVAAEGRR